MTPGASGPTGRRCGWRTAVDGKIYAYDMATKARVPGKEFETLQAAGNHRPTGIWSDGETMWVTDDSERQGLRLQHAGGDGLRRANRPDCRHRRVRPEPGRREFDDLRGGNRGTWSDSTTVWVTDSYGDNLIAYDLARKAQGRREGFLRSESRREQ